MRRKFVSTRRSHGGQAVVGETLTKDLARGATSAMEGIFGVRHVVDLMHSPQAALLEGCIVRNKGETRKHGLQLAPHHGKAHLKVGIAACHAVHTRVVKRIVVGHGAHKAMHTVLHHTLAHNNNAHRADTRRVAIGSLEVYGNKISHAYRAS